MPSPTGRAGKSLRCLLSALCEPWPCATRPLASCVAHFLPLEETAQHSMSAAVSIPMRIRPCGARGACGVPGTKAAARTRQRLPNALMLDALATDKPLVRGPLPPPQRGSNGRAVAHAAGRSPRLGFPHFYARTCPVFTRGISCSTVCPTNVPVRKRSEHRFPQTPRAVGASRRRNHRRRSD
jgi:hypothetical protein